MLTITFLIAITASYTLSLFCPEIHRLLIRWIDLQFSDQLTNHLTNQPITPPNHYNTINCLEILRSANYPSPVYPPAPPSTPVDRMFIFHEIESFFRGRYCPIHRPNPYPFGWVSPPPIHRHIFHPQFIPFP